MLCLNKYTCIPSWDILRHKVDMRTTQLEHKNNNLMWFNETWFLCPEIREFLEKFKVPPNLSNHTGMVGLYFWLSLHRMITCLSSKWVLMVFTNSWCLHIKVNLHVVDADLGQKAFLCIYLMNSADGSWGTHAPFAITSQSVGSKLQCHLCSTGTSQWWHFHQ